ncbi:MAG: glycosyltransferase family 39 protein [Thermodesulfobacteriota bacterium]
MAEDNRLLWGRSPGWWAVVLMAAFTLARLWFIGSGQVELVQDEAQYWDWSRTLQLSYFTKPPLIAYLIRLSTDLLGDSDFAVRLPAVAGSLAVQALLYLGLAKGLGRPRLGLAALAAANGMLLFMVSGVLMTTDNLLLVFWTAALFLLHAALRRRPGAGILVLLALTAAAGVLAKYMMLVIIPVALAAMLLLRRAGLLAPGAAVRVLAALVVGCLLGFSPILAWNIQHDWVGYRHVATLAGVEGQAAQSFLRLDRMPEYLAGQVGLVTPWWLCFMLWGGWRALRLAWRGGEEGGFLDRGQAAVLAAGFWPMWLAVLLWSLHAKIQPNWPAVSYAAGAALAGAAFLDLVGRRGLGSPRVWAWPALSLLLFAATHAHDWLPIPYRADIPVPFRAEPVTLENPAVRLKGWSHLGAEVERLRMTAFADPDKVFIFAGNYDLTAALAFHTPGHPRTYCVNVGRRYNQYDLWPGPEDKLGWDAIYVRQKFKDAIEPQVDALFARTVQRHFQTLHEGRPARQFTIYLCYGFKGPWPQGLGSGY